MLPLEAQLLHTATSLVYLDEYPILRSHLVRHTQDFLVHSAQCYTPIHDTYTVHYTYTKQQYAVACQYVCVETRKPVMVMVCV